MAERVPASRNGTSEASDWALLSAAETRTSSFAALSPDVCDSKTPLLLKK